MMDYRCHFTQHSNFAANLNNKADALDQQAICFHLPQHAKSKNKSHKR